MGKQVKKTEEEIRAEVYEKKAVKTLSGRRKGECLPLETGDMTAVLNLITSSLKRYGGMPYKYPPTEEGLKLFVDRSQSFFEYVNEVNADPNLEKKLIPDVETWSVYIGITRQTIYEYAARGGQWATAIDFFKNAINSAKKQLAFSYKIPAMLYVFDSVNNHSYHNVSEFHVSAAPSNVVSEQSELERELISNGLTWDDNKGEFEAIDVKGEIIDVDLRPNNESDQSTSQE